MNDKLLELYSPIQLDMIDRDNPGHSIPLQAAGHDREQEYLDRIMSIFGELQAQEDARSAFAVPEQIHSEVSEKILSFTRTVCMINGRPYGVYSCQSRGTLDKDEVESLEWYCREQWERGWGEGYAHCPGEGASLGLYIHFWQDERAPLLTRDQLETVLKADQNRPVIAEINPDTFWMLLSQAKDACGQDQQAFAYWLTERLLAMGSEQTMNFYRITQGYMELADKYGLWNAATLMQEDVCYSDGFEDFRAWLIAQGKDIYLSALKNPDSLVDVPDCDDCRFMHFLYIGDTVHERLTGHTAYRDMDSKAHRQLVEELRKDIVYGAEIEYPHEWSEVAAYLPRLTAKYLTPEELRACICRGHLWNHNDPDIQKARAVAPKKKKSQKKKGGKAR